MVGKTRTIIFGEVDDVDIYIERRPNVEARHFEAGQEEPMLF